MPFALKLAVVLVKCEFPNVTVPAPLIFVQFVNFVPPPVKPSSVTTPCNVVGELEMICCAPA